jgi:serine/threonine protein phosphatase PrpC
VTGVDCPSCADERAAGAAFCEACGNALRAPEAETAAPKAETGAPEAETGAPVAGACPHCGTAGAIGGDGYCTNCGMLAGRPRDHIEADAGAVAAGVTDRGLRHHRNEDALWLAVRGSDVDVVVCDGVSASFDPDVASEVAVEMAGGLLAGAGDELPKQVALAIEAAAAAVAGLATTGDPRRAASNPACTIVAACVRGDEIGYGWIGDSRAYWIPADGAAEQLTEDDSWATHAIAMGADPQTAWNDAKAHAITAWLGADAGRPAPRTGQRAVTAPGHLVLCSDGLWNYRTEPAAFADTVRTRLAGADGDLIAAARALTAFANDAGGADNITVALIPVTPAASSVVPAAT